MWTFKQLHGILIDSNLLWILVHFFQSTQIKSLKLSITITAHTSTSLSFLFLLAIYNILTNWISREHTVCMLAASIKLQKFQVTFSHTAAELRVLQYCKGLIISTNTVACDDWKEYSPEDQHHFFWTIKAATYFAMTISAPPIKL